MNLAFNKNLVGDFKSNSQVARILTEDWVLRNSYCPSCGNKKLNQYSNNNPAADFYCIICKSDFELKGGKNSLEDKVVDGSYNSMIRKIQTLTNPNLFFLNYLTNYLVNSFFVIPKYFFTPEIIERRKPLSPLARRSGWIGCNILVKNLPLAGRIFFVKNGVIIDRTHVLDQWKKTNFLNQENLNNRGWFLELISIIEKIPNETFTLSDVYAFEDFFKIKFPKNRFVKEKIRQQLQALRDKGFITFIGKGIYQKN